MFSTGVSAYALSILSLATTGSAFFRMPCPGRIVQERADPIVSPGAVSGHVHTISGGNGFDFTMDYADARASTCSSCPIKEDLSNYWTPKLYYQAENGTFQDVPQSGDSAGSYGGMTVYYLQRGGPNNDNLTAFPEGFRMLAGDPFKRAATTDFAGQAVSFVCLDYSTSTSESTYTSGLPNKTCPDGLRAQVFFPSCWDGVNLDSSDHKSHMSYPSSVAYNNGPCPASHPVHMISIFFEVLYSTDGFEWWNGTQQPFVFAQGDPTGYGFHGDFVNGWDIDALQNATDNCLNDSGLITDCDVFSFFTDAESKACIIAPEVDEQVTGVLDALPGCNPVTWGPGEAPSSYANCPVTEIGTAKVYYTNVTGFDYLGCGYGGSPQTFNGSSYTSSSAMTVESCLSYCKSRGYHYSGLEYGSQCYCGNSLASDRAPVSGVLGNCITPCTGNSSEICGGDNVLSMYYTDTVDATISCPSGNMTTFTNSNGTTFLAQCGMSYTGGDISMVYVTNGIQSCIESCGALEGCQSVTLSGTACYRKNSNTLKVSLSGANSAKLVSGSSSSSSSSSSTSSTKTSSASTASGSSTKTSSATGSTSSSKTSSVVSSSSVASSASALSSSVSSSTTKTSTSTTSSASSTSTVLCPDRNATIYTEPNTGYQFLLECGIDHAGGDMGMVYVNTFAGCITACATTSGCVDVAMSGTACYLKKSIGAAVYDGVKGARLVAYAASSSSSVSVASSTSSSSVASSASSSSSASVASSTSSSAKVSSTAASSSSTSTVSSSSATSSGLSSSSKSSSTSASTGTSAVQANKAVSSATSSSSSVKSSSTAVTSSSKSSSTTSKSSTTTAKSSTTTSKSSTTTTTSSSSNAAVQAKVATTSSSSSSSHSSSTTSKSSTSTSKSTTASTSSASYAAAAVQAKVATTTTSSSSVKASTTSTKSSTTTSASASSTPLCPNLNSTIYTEPTTGHNFTIECGIDHSGGQLEMVYVSNFTQCIFACANTTGCVDVSLRSTACYLKKSVGTIVYDSGIYGARLVTSSTSSSSILTTATSSSSLSSATTSKSSTTTVKSSSSSSSTSHSSSATSKSTSATAAATTTKK